jgi:hemoglobin
VDDFLPRILDDPRVNFDRKGVTQGGFSFHRGKSEEWNATPENIATLKVHLVQFFDLATGGPSKYQGKEMKSAHANMHITNAEFDASLGDLKATLDKLGVGVKEQKELLAVVESTRPEIVQDR